MSDTEVDYLQPGFDPKSLTVPRLRSILVTHNVQYPSTAKKSQLIDLFIEEVIPQSKKILSARQRVKRMSRGIVDADSGETASTDFSTEQENLPPPPSARRSRSPKKTRIKREPEEVDHISLTPAVHIRDSPRKRQSRSVSTQPPPVASDVDTASEVEAPKPVRRSNYEPRADYRANYHSTPAPKLEPVEQANFFKHTPETESVFTSDNPFQSGANTPATAMKTPTHRRKTSGFDSTRKGTTPGTARRRTDAPSFADALSKSYTPSAVSRTFEIPARPETPETSEHASEYASEYAATEHDEIEAGEEFTPDEQLALTQEEANNPQLAIARALPSTKRGSSLTTPFWVLVTTLLVAYAAWYRQEKVAVGYCGLGREPTQLIPSTIPVPEWANDLASKYDVQIPNIQVPQEIQSYLEPECEPCPSHAYCFEDFTVRCEPDFLLKPHPLSLGGLVPLPPTCEPDGEKVRRVQAVADKAVGELRDRRAKYECNQPLESEGEPLESPDIEEQELKEILSQKRSKRMTQEEFDELWTAALGEVKARDEVEVKESPETGGAGRLPATTLSSSSLSRLPITCALQRSVRHGVARNRIPIASLIFAILSLIYGRRRYQVNRALNAQVPALVDEVLNRLANQKELAFEEEGDDAFLFLPNLRDDLLRSMHNLADRERLWQRVRALVEQNANVRTGQRESHNGEMGRAWEWIGPSRIAASGEGGSSGRRRKSMRVSWGPEVKTKQGAGVDESKAVVSDGRKHRKWEEGGGRPIY
ncbi:Man1-Src1p-C-terminal domain-containing protein [Cladorrhinum sp. PSN332]|nr:Man1-Src1p-C-terminal domain-containing protein [Cladorrhinum sp. PSN332]